MAARNTYDVYMDGAAATMKSRPRASVRASRRAAFGESGFTLIEIVLVILLIGLIAALAIPRFPQQPTAGLVARRLVSDMRYAKEMAMRLQTMCGVYFISSTQYRVFQNNDTNNAVKDPTTGTNLVVTMAGEFSGVTIGQTFTNSIVKFDALGTPFEGSGAGTALAAAKTITLSGPGGPRSVTVEPNTGKVGGP